MAVSHCQKWYGHDPKAQENDYKSKGNLEQYMYALS